VPTLHPSLTGGGRRISAERVVALLKRRESALRTKILVMLVLGVPLSFVGPFFFTFMGWAIWHENSRKPYPFWTAFTFITLVSLPLLYLLAWILKGSILDRSAETMSPFAQRRTGAGLLVLDLANIGPRMVLYGMKCRSERKRCGDADIERAALAVAALSAFQTSVPPVQLLQNGEPAEQLEPLLGFLMHHQMVDISATGDRVWLNSDLRRKLEA
jgi:hypothetical protein